MALFSSSALASSDETLLFLGGPWKVFGNVYITRCGLSTTTTTMSAKFPVQKKRRHNEHKGLFVFTSLSGGRLSFFTFRHLASFLRQGAGDWE
jgi:hypothetical protein